MIDPVDELETRAAMWCKRNAGGEAAALPRLRALPEFTKADAATLAADAQSIRLKQCLAVVAREHGFDFDWPRPRDRVARRRLYGKPLRAHRGES